ncbi:MAG: diguanylate cyclase [Dehalococcoidia bacterium]
MTAEKLRALVDAHEFAGSDRRAHVTISIGVATLTDSHIAADETARRLLARADAAMYDAKRAGRTASAWRTVL